MRTPPRLTAALPAIISLLALGAGAARATQFVTETVDTTPIAGLYTSVAIDTAGIPWIAYFRAAEFGGEVGEVRLVRKSGTQWPLDIVDNQFLQSDGGYTALRIDQNNARHIAYYGNAFGDLKYAFRGAGVWSRLLVDADGQTGLQAALAIGPAGVPQISYLDGTNLNLRWAVRSGSAWQIETVDAAGFFGYASTAIAVDGSGRPHIAYYSRTTGKLRYATKPGATWDLSDVDALHATDPYVAIALDGAGTPRLAYVAGDTTNTQLRYAVRSGTSWTIEDVDDPDPNVGYFPSLAITSKGEPRISYYDLTNEDLSYASKIAGDWSIEKVDTTGNVGYFTSLALDSDDQPRISYFDFTRNALKFADILRPISIAVTQSPPGSIPAGGTLQLTASATFTDLVVRDVSDSAAWASSNEAVATVSATGLVDAIGAGSAVIRATLGRVSGQRAVTVTAASVTALEVVPADTSLADGLTAQLSAFDVLSDESRVARTSGITWTSRNTGVATVSGSGLVTAASPGVVRIVAQRATAPALTDSATLTVLPAALLSLAVTPENPSLLVGFTQQFSANGLFTDGGNVDLTASVTWSSSALGVATITPSGRATAAGPGQTFIRARSGAAVDSTVLSVSAASDSVTLAMPAGVYRAISFPIFPDDPSILAVLDELGTPDRTAWRFWRWSPRDSTYIEAGAGFTTILPGEGYWLITKSAANVRAKGTPPPGTDFVISLLDGPGNRPAWTFVANPFAERVFTNDLRVSDGAQTFELTDPANVLTERVVKGGDAPPFIDASSLQSGLGYWIKKIAAGPVQVIVSPPSPGSPAAAALRGSDSREPGAESAPRWSVRITARQGARVSETVEAGVADVAAGAWSARDRSLPPAPPGDYLRLAALEGSWGRLSGLYTASFRAPGEPAAWELSLSGAEAPGEIELVVSGPALPAGAAVVLDDGRGTRVLAPAEALASGEQAFVLAAAPGPMALRLTVIDAGGAEPPALSLAPGFVGAYPNPFRDATGLRFRVDAQSDLSAAIYDPSGRLVRELAAVAANPGEHVLVWDGRDGSGHPLAPGVYLARWQAGASQGAGRVVLLR